MTDPMFNATGVRVSIAAAVLGELKCSREAKVLSWPSLGQLGCPIALPSRASYSLLEEKMLLVSGKFPLPKPRLHSLRLSTSDWLKISCRAPVGISLLLRLILKNSRTTQSMGNNFPLQLSCSFNQQEAH